MNTRSLAIAGGVAALGWLLYSYFNKANAAQAAALNANPALARATGAGAGNLITSAYSPPALNASVPGVSFAPSTVQPGILTSTLTAVPAVTSQQVAGANAFWATLTPVVPLASGYITFPSGAQAAAATFGGGNTAMDGNGNLYVLWAGQVYQLGSQDSAGNYPALAVNATPGSAPAQAGTQSDFSWLLTS
jgi:hypothetical protein